MNNTALWTGTGFVGLLVAMFLFFLVKAQG